MVTMVKQTIVLISYLEYDNTMMVILCITVFRKELYTWKGSQWTYHTRKYYIEYTYIMADTVYVNIIDSNLLAQVDFNGKYHMIVNEYNKQRDGPDYLTITNSHYEKRNVFKRYKRATCVCEVCVQWKYGSKY